MANESLKAFALKNNVPLWKVADRLGVHECTLSRRLRHELSPEEKLQIRTLIKQISAKQDLK